MHAFTALWLPTLLSAVAVFFLSSIIHMVVPWHKNDYMAFPNEDAVLDALRPHNLATGEYMAPKPATRQDMTSPAFVEKVKRGPLVIMNIAQGDSVSMGRPLVLWLVYVIVVSALAGHIAFGASGGHPDDSRIIFHTVALTSLLAYAGALWQQTIWFRKPWLSSFKGTFDGLIYAVVTGVIFVYLWPKT
jgi:hypothetical protein